MDVQEYTAQETKAKGLPKRVVQKEAPAKRHTFMKARMRNKFTGQKGKQDNQLVMTLVWGRRKKELFLQNS